MKKNYLFMIAIVLLVGLVIFKMIAYTRLHQRHQLEVENTILVKEKFSLFRNASKIITATKKGKAVETFISLTPTYTLYMEGEKVAYAKTSFLSIGNEILYYDGDDRYLGRLKEEILKSRVLSWSTTYSLYNPSDSLIATSKKLDFWGSTITLQTPAGEQICTIHRPKRLLSFGYDRWEIEIQKPGVVDERILTLIPVYKTHADNKKEEEKEKEKKE